MLAETVLGFVASKVLDHLANETISSTGRAASDRVRTWLGRDPQKLAVEVALAQTEARFAEAHPRWHGAMFDKDFLAGPAAPLLARAFTRAETVTAPELAQAWAGYLGGETGQRYASDVEPAATDLLRWWREELGGLEPFRDALNSRSLDSIVTAAVETKDAVQNLSAAVHDLGTDVRSALSELDHALVRARYPALEDFVDWESREMVRSADKFVGREWVFTYLDEFCQRHRCGYLRLVGEAGLGKTALASAIAARYGTAAFFFNEREGRVRHDRCLNHLSVEVISRAGLAYERLPDHAGEDTGFLMRVLREAAEVDAVWVVIDALDEARAAHSGDWALPLPERLPVGVFIVVTHRPGDHPPSIAAGSGTALETLRLTADDNRQQSDVVRYLRHRVEHDEGLSGAIARIQPPVTSNEFVETMATASEGNFMYLAYVLDDLASPTPPGWSDGTGTTSFFAQLPQGLDDYYRRMWKVIAAAADREVQQWEDLYRPVIERLAAATEPVTVQWLADQTGRQPQEIQRRALNGWQRFLRHSPATQRWHIIHQSFRDYLDDTGEVDLSAAHRAIANYYLVDDTRWTEHDGYPNRRLASHLEAATLHQRLLDLAASTSWREAQLLYDSSGTTFLSDVALAWNVAAEADRLAAERGDSPPFLVHEVLCALATAEVHSFSGDLPKELLARLLRAGLWTGEQAVSAADRTPEPHARAEALLALAPHLPQQLRDRARMDAWRLARTLPEPSARVHVLVAVAAHFSDVSQNLVVSRARYTASEIRDPHSRARALTAVAPLLSDVEREVALSDAVVAAHDSGDDLLFEETLSLLAPPLPDRLYARALDLVMASGRSAPDALAALAPHLPEALLTEAAAAAEAIEDPYVRARALAGLAPQLSGHARSHALTAAYAASRSLLHPSERALALATVARELPSGQRDGAIAEVVDALVSEGASPGLTAIVLAALGPHLPDELRAQAVADAVRPVRVGALRALAPYLSSELAGFALEAVADDPDGLAAVAPYLTTELLRRALDAAAGDPDLLAVLAPYLPHELFTDAIADAKSADREEHPLALAALAAHVPDELLADTLGLLTAPNAYLHARALAVLCRHLPAEQQARARDDAIAAAATTPPPQRAEVLALLGPVLPNNVFADAVAAASLAATRPYFRAEPLAALAPHLPHEYLADALEATRHVDPYLGASALAALVPQLDKELLREALAIGLRARRSEHRAHALAALAPQLPEDERAGLLEDALAAANEVTDSARRGPILAAIAVQLPEPQCVETFGAALAAAQAVPEPAARAHALADIAAVAPDEQRDRIVEEAMLATYAIADCSKRADALIGLAPHLHDELLTRALALVGVPARDTLTDVLALVGVTLGDTQADAGASHAREMPPDFQRELFVALARVGKMEPMEPKARGVVVAALARHLADAPAPDVHHDCDVLLRVGARSGLSVMAEIADAAAPLVARLSGNV
jgi:hypothetical protein